MRGEDGSGPDCFKCRFNLLSVHYVPFHATEPAGAPPTRRPPSRPLAATSRVPPTPFFPFKCRFYALKKKKKKIK